MSSMPPPDDGLSEKERETLNAFAGGIEALGEALQNYLAAVEQKDAAKNAAQHFKANLRKLLATYLPR